MSIRAIIVDDEYKARAVLALILKEIAPDIKVCASVSSVEEAVNAIKKWNPALVFLDIEMPNESGFFLFERLGGIANFETIFTTAFTQYAVEAFKVNALDYILKPVEPTELDRAVKKALRAIAKSSAQHSSENRFKKETDDVVPHNDKLIVPSIDGVRFFSLADIIRLEADGAYSRIFFKGQPSFLSSKNLGEYEERLKRHKAFMRVHRSTIINTNEVARFAEGRHIIMSDETVVQVSRHFKSVFLDRMKDSDAAKDNYNYAS